MLFLHDIWVNWFEGEEDANFVHHFHDWKKEDEVNLLDQVALLKVSEETFNYIENGLNEIPSELLSEVYQQSYMRKNHERFKIDYCFTISDGNNVLAIDTKGGSTPVRKSRLTPRQYQLALDFIESEKVKTENYEIPSEKENPINQCFIGLTRREKELKRKLMDKLNQIVGRKDVHELRYWTMELLPEQSYKEIVNKDYSQLWEILTEGVKRGWKTDWEKSALVSK